MNPQGKGSFPLFRVAGITVYLHWSWLVVAGVELTLRAAAYPSLAWNAAEYLALFGIVLLHEFGHAFACRQVGGTAERIVLWPLGGIAYVNPPPRPGALLWSIAAGPLVNVVLVPVTVGLWLLVQQAAPPGLLAQAGRFCFAVAAMNLLLLVFNLLPIYPLDGGQILHALLWFVLGRARSLAVCSAIGLLGAGGLFLLALRAQDTWLIVLAVFLAFQAVTGFRRARTLSWLEPALGHINQALASLRQGASAEAVAACDRALELIPAGHQVRADAHACRAMALARAGDHPAAHADLDEAIRLRPGHASYYVNRGLSHAHQGEYARAVEDYAEALRLAPDLPAALNNLAWLMATARDPDFRDGARAVEYARRACELAGWKEPSHLGTLAAACAESGDYAAAVTWQKKALEDPRYVEQHGEQARGRVRLYEEGKPYREEVPV